MDRSKLREICAAHIPRLKDFLGLSDWRVYWEFRRDDDDSVMARCVMEQDYKQACISIDMDGVETDAEVVDILFHELCHILTSSFDTYKEIVAQMVPNITDGRPNGMVENRAWRHASERAVLRIEWIWRNHLRDIYMDQFTGK